jgi:signal transduction histidine kinase/CheY-like chemotaxis protein
VTLGLREVLLVPLRARGITSGCIAMVRFGNDARPFEPRDLAAARQIAAHAALALYDTQLLGELRRELADRRRVEDNQRTLIGLAREWAAATGDQRGLIDLVTRRLGEIIGECCTIRLVEDGKLEAMRSVYHPDPAYIDRVRETIRYPQLQSQGLSGQVFASGVSTRASEPEPELLAQRMTEPVSTWIRTLGIRAVLAVPLIQGQQILGVVTMWRTGPIPYSADDQAIAEGAASHAVLALANARLFSETQRELAERTRMRDRLTILTEVARELAAQTGNLTKLLELVVRRFGEIVGEACVIRLVAEDGETFDRVGAVWHADPEVIAAERERILAQPQRIGEGIAGQVLMHGRPLLVNATPEQFAARTSGRFAATILRYRFRSMLAVPLRSGGNVIAVVTMTRADRRYTDDDIEVVRELATHASLALHNSRLIEETRKELAERKRAEDSLRKTEEQFRQAQKMEAVGRLAGGIAHDFNNLLTVIVNAASVLLEDLDEGHPGARADVEDIQTAAQRAADLTRQLLAFSRQQVLEPRILDLNAIVDKMQKMFARVVGEDISLKVELDPALGSIKADPGHINQVLMNIAVNARDAMPGGGTLTTRTANVLRDGIPHVMLAISDTGIGMDAATQSRIFEPFFTTKDKGKGTGLGLSTVFGIVQQSGGSMVVESELGHGSAFKIYLPRTDEVAIEVPTEVRPLRGGETILLVEDDGQVRKVATAILQRSGYRVLEAESGPDAIARYSARLGEVDLLLSDVVMPKMSGRELADQLVGIRPDLRVLYMSGYTDDAIMHHRVLDSGAVLVAKPFTQASLLDRVRDVLSRTS